MIKHCFVNYGTNKRGEFKAGQFAAVVEAGSTLKSPKFLIGRVLYFSSDDSNEVCLLYYENIKGSIYKLVLDGTPWTENESSLVEINLAPSKNICDCFTLLTAARTIHKKVFKD